MTENPADAVSAYVDSLPNTHDGRMVAALALGVTTAMFERMKKGDGPIRVASVKISVDAQGNYRDYVIVTTESGIKLKVHITEYP